VLGPSPSWEGEVRAHQKHDLGRAQPNARGRINSSVSRTGGVVHVQDQAVEPVPTDRKGLSGDMARGAQDYADGEAVDPQRRHQDDRADDDRDVVHVGGKGGRAEDAGRV